MWPVCLCSSLYTTFKYSRKKQPSDEFLWLNALTSPLSLPVSKVISCWEAPLYSRSMLLSAAAQTAQLVCDLNLQLRLWQLLCYCLQWNLSEQGCYRMWQAWIACDNRDHLFKKHSWLNSFTVHIVSDMYTVSLCWMWWNAIIPKQNLQCLWAASCAHLKKREQSVKRVQRVLCNNTISPKSTGWSCVMFHLWVKYRSESQVLVLGPAWVHKILSQSNLSKHTWERCSETAMKKLAMWT